MEQLGLKRREIEEIFDLEIAGVSALHYVMVDCRQPAYQFASEIKLILHSGRTLELLGIGIVISNDPNIKAVGFHNLHPLRRRLPQELDAVAAKECNVPNVAVEERQGLWIGLVLESGIRIIIGGPVWIGGS